MKYADFCTLFPMKYADFAQPKIREFSNETFVNVLLYPSHIFFDLIVRMICVRRVYMGLDAANASAYWNSDSSTGSQLVQ